MTMKKKDWKPGMQFGSYIIDECREDGAYLVHCAKCGKPRIISYCGLWKADKRGSSCLSCSFADKNITHTTHGLCIGGESRDYSILRGIDRRCYNPKFKAYKNYGGRGIRIDPPWKVDGHLNYSAFHEWYVREEAKAQLVYDEKYWDRFQVDRIDNEGNYSPENCRLTIPYEQVNNTRLTRHIDNIPMKFWYDAHKSENIVTYDTFRCRVVELGWEPLDAIQRPVRPKKRKLL